MCTLNICQQYKYIDHETLIGNVRVSNHNSNVRHMRNFRSIDYYYSCFNYGIVYLHTMELLKCELTLVEEKSIRNTLV